MKNILIILCTGLLFLNPAAAGNKITSTLLERGSVSWDGGTFSYPQGQPEISIVKISIQTDGEKVALPIHCHPVPLAAYVLKGNVLVQLKSTGKSKLFTSGEALIEVSDTWHHGVFTEDTELVVFYAGKKGLPVTVKEGEDSPLSAECK